MEPYLAQFDPVRDDSGWVSESPSDYVARMKSGPLPHWPDEVLVEWLHRHNRHADRYAFLGFERLSFQREIWPLERVPGREAFYDPRFCDDFMDVDRRARLSMPDWLARYMLERGTWNTPIILLSNPSGGIAFPSGEHLRTPVHLLEGHRRLAFLNGMRSMGRALPEHEIWIAQWRP